MIGSGWKRASRRRLPQRLALAVAALLIPVLAGCEAGNEAPTLRPHQPTDGTSAMVGTLGVRNAFVLGAPLGQLLSKGQSASLFLALTNTGATDRLIGISAPDTAGSVTLPSSSIPVTDSGPVLYSGPAPQLVLNNLTRTVTSGSTVKLVLTFQNAGPITLLVPVMPRAAQYASYAPPQPAPAPTQAAAAASASPSPSGSASASASPSAGASATSSPSPSP